jgi:DNA-binding MarR family transcriptional regulator
MEKKNLIIRKQNPSDGRSVLIFLTEFGKYKRDDSRSVVLNFNKHIESKLNKQQVKNFLEVAECIMIESKKFENFIIN